MGLTSASVCLVLLAMASFASADDAVIPIARSSQLFAARVYQELKNNEGNILICPVSVQTIMALVQEGAKSETSDEISRGLFLPTEKSTTRRGYEQLMNHFKNSQGVEMDIANRVYVKDGYTLKQEFKDVAVQSYGSGVENIDFTKSAAAANTMNTWVEEKTHGKIRNLISADNLNEDTALVLINALYFKGKWETKFPTYGTADLDFWTSPSKSIKVPMMSNTAHFKYAENAALDCKFLELPYQGNQFSMTIVLPNKRDGLRELEEKISEVLQPQNYVEENVEVKLPKFSTETEIQFHDVLQKMGMRKPFSSDADFSGFLETVKPLKISKVIQKNFINVTEDGTEAASATAVDTMFRSAFPLETQVFNADHPFLYFIQEMNTSTFIFIGRFETNVGQSPEQHESVELNVATRGRDSGIADDKGGAASLCVNTMLIVFLIKFLHSIF